MTTYARIVDGRAVDVTATDPAELFHPDLAATFVKVPDGTAAGDTKSGSKWIQYVAPVTVAVPSRPPVVTPPQFKMLILAELPQILAKTATDTAIAAFVSVIDDPRLTEVDLSLQTVTTGLAYAFGAIGYDAEKIAARLAEVKTGVLV